MGYRSDVRIVVSKKGQKELNDYIKKYISKEEEPYNLLEHTDFYRETPYSTYMGWNCVKWYEESYKDVMAVMSGLEHLKDKDISFRYARIGEDYDDYDEKYYDSKTDEDDYLTFPNIIREFDEDDINKCLDYECNHPKEDDLEI